MPETLLPEGTFVDMIGECCAKERLAWQNHTWHPDIARS